MLSPELCAVGFKASSGGSRAAGGLRGAEYAVEEEIVADVNKEEQVSFSETLRSLTWELIY